MRIRTFLASFAASVLLGGAAIAGSIISQIDFDRCIRPAVTDTSSVQNFKVDFSLVPTDCADTISRYATGTGDHPVSIKLIALTQEAIASGLVPKSSTIVVADIGLAEQAEWKAQSN